MEKSKPLSLKDRVEAFRPYHIQLKQMADQFYHSEAYKQPAPGLVLGRRHVLRMQHEEFSVMPGKSFDHLMQLLGVSLNDPFVRGYLTTISSLNERETKYIYLTPEALRLFMDIKEMYEKHFAHGIVGDFAKLFDEHASVIADLFNSKREGMLRLNEEGIQAQILDLLLDVDALKRKHSANTTDSHSDKSKQVARINELTARLHPMDEKTIAEHIGKMNSTYLRRNHPSTLPRTSVANLEEIIEALESMVSLAGMDNSDDVSIVQVAKQESASGGCEEVFTELIESTKNLLYEVNTMLTLAQKHKFNIDIESKKALFNAVRKARSLVLQGTTEEELFR